MKFRINAYTPVYGQKYSTIVDITSTDEKIVFEELEYICDEIAGSNACDWWDDEFIEKYDITEEEFFEGSYAEWETIIDD